MSFCSSEKYAKRSALSVEKSALKLPPSCLPLLVKKSSLNIIPKKCVVAALGEEIDLEMRFKS